jgi:protein-S-isoprenylcysteine O-methyltransferase Ste14
VAVEWAGRTLVVLQFGLLAILGWRAWLHLLAPGLAAASCLAGSAALAVWALVANRPGNFNIRPTPRSGGSLVTHGPYRWIRHPMYTAVLLAAAAAGMASGQVLDALLWTALLAVLWAKAVIEERALLVRYPAYQDYRQRTRRFLPWIV